MSGLYVPRAKRIDFYFPPANRAGETSSVSSNPLPSHGSLSHKGAILLVRGVRSPLLPLRWVALILFGRSFLTSVKRTNINLREHQHKALAELSAKTGATVSELIRRAIDEYLKKRQ